MRQFRLIIVLIFISITNDVLAQDNRFIHYTTENGLPSSTVYKIIQDSKGFMWFTTKAGVARFDGNEFKLFTTKNGLTDNFILSIYEDRDQRIWLVDYSGKLCYIKNDSVYHLIAAEKYDFVAIDIHQDNDYNLWINTLRNGIIKCGRDGSYIEPLAPNSIPNRILTLSQDNNGVLWFGSSAEYGVVKQVNGKYQVKEYHVNDSLLCSPNVRVPVLLTKKNRVFAVTCTHILEIHDSTYSLVYSLKKSGKFSSFSSIQPDHLGNLLIATDNGAYKLDIDDFGMTTLVDSGIFNIIYEDREGNLWFSTPINGVYFLSKSARSIENFGKSNGLFDEAITAISADNYGNIYLGSASGSIYTYKQGKINLINLEKKRDNGILSISPIDSNTIWIGINSGLVKYNTRVLSWHKKTLEASPEIFKDNQAKVSKMYNHIKISPVRALLPLSNRVLLFGNSRLFQIESFPDHYLLKKLNLITKINSLCIDQDSIIWIGSINGLWQKQKDIYNHPQDVRLQTSNISDLKVDDQNILWVATTNQGVFAYHDSVILHLDEDDGLASNNVYDLDVKKNIVWVANSRGLDRITVRSKLPELTYTILLVNKRKGLAMDEVLSVCQDDDLVFAGTNKGFTMFKNSELGVDSMAPPIRFSSFMIWDKDTFLTSDYSLSHDRNNITIKYVSLYYGSYISYKYKMEGLSQNWITTTNREVSYPILPPGNYKFVVKAVNADGIESTYPASINLTINPPFWKTWWFQTLYWSLGLLLIGGMIYLIVRYYRSREELRNRMLELERMALRSQMNPHFIFNALNSIHDFIEEHDQKSAHLYLAKFAKLIRLILENSNKKYIFLVDELKALELYIVLENLRFSNKFDYQINVDGNINIYETKIPPMLIQPYVENAIRHGLMKKKGRGNLEIKISENDGKLCCLIRDDEIGRAKAARMNSQRLRQHRSMGMQITQERLDAIQFKNKTTDILITDLKDENGIGVGTMVKFSVPLEKGGLVLHGNHAFKL